MATSSEKEFIKNRRLQLLNLPPSTTGQEIKDYLCGIKVKDVKFSENLDSAIVELYFGTQVDDAVEKFNGKHFKDNVLIVRPAPIALMMCISHIPLSYSNDQFQNFCRKLGPFKYAYTIRTRDTELCKGYGFVEFDCDVEKANGIKSQLDWMEVEGQFIHAEFLDDAVQASYQLLQSKCLLITGMPETFTDITKMRELFGCITSPVYCQIIARDEKSLGYGIVEYKTAEDAEATWMKMKDEKVEGNAINMSFCIPGKSAVVINNRILCKFADKLKRQCLLPDPVNARPVIGGSAIYVCLIKAYPKLGGEFASVLTALQQAYVAQKVATKDRPGLLGPAPNLPVSPVMNPDIQLAIIVLMAMSYQKAKKEPFYGVMAKYLNSMCEIEGGSTVTPKPSILGDPVSGQAGVLVNSLKKQLDEKPMKDDNGKEVVEPLQLQDKLRFIFKKFVANTQFLNFGQLATLGQLLNAIQEMTGEAMAPLRPPPGTGGGGGLLHPPMYGPTSTHLGKGKAGSLLGPMPGEGRMMNQMMNNGGFMNEPVHNKGASLLGEGPMGGMGGGKPQSLMGSGPSPKSHQQEQQNMNNQAIVQAMGLGIGASGMNNLNQTLLGQISQGLVHQIGQNLMYQLSVNQNNNGSSQSGGGPGGKGLLGDVPPSQSSPMAGTRNKAAGKNSLLGEAPAPFKNNQGNQNTSDQGSWKSSDARWGNNAGAYESGYGAKSAMGGSSGYNDFSGGYGESYNQDMSGGFGGYGVTSGGYGEGDYYNNYQQYNYGTGGGFGNASGNMGGSNSGANFGMGTGHGSNQASGVNFQDGSYGKSGNSSGLGQDSGRYTGADGYGGNMAANSMGFGGYGMNRDASNYDSYSSSGMGNNYGGGMNDMGMGNNAGGGNTMGGNYGVGSSSNNQMGAYSTGMSNFSGSGMGSGNSGNTMMDTMGSSVGNYNSGMGGAGTGGSLLGSYGSGNMGGGAASKTAMSGLGAGGQRDQGAMGGNNTYYTTGSSAGGGSASGLLPNPAAKYNINAQGQKRSFSQLMTKQDTSSVTPDYMSSIHQGMGGSVASGVGTGVGTGVSGGVSGGVAGGVGAMYADSYKRSRLY